MDTDDTDFQSVFIYVHLCPYLFIAQPSNTSNILLDVIHLL